MQHLEKTGGGGGLSVLLLSERSNLATRNIQTLFLPLLQSSVHLSSRRHATPCPHQWPRRSAKSMPARSLTPAGIPPWKRTSFSKAASSAVPRFLPALPLVNTKCSSFATVTSRNISAKAF